VGDLVANVATSRRYGPKFLSELPYIKYVREPPALRGTLQPLRAVGPCRRVLLNH
jgi:hypothetical protein